MIDVAEITELLSELQRSENFQPAYLGNDLGDEHSLEVTVATTDGESWVYQTGDNSFFGPCYFHPFWAVVWLHSDSDPAELAADLVQELDDLVEEDRYLNGESSAEEGDES